MLELAADAQPDREPVSEPIHVQAKQTDALSLEKLKGKRVLIVEDNEINQEVSKAQLEAVGIDCEVAWNGQEAIEKFTAYEAGYFDAILMDIRMPVMDGKEATRCLRRLDRSDAVAIPIIALTTDVFEDVRQSIMECGMNAYLDKPVYAEELYTVLLKVWKNV